MDIVWIFTFADRTKKKLLGAGLTSDELIKMCELHGKVTVSYTHVNIEAVAQNEERVAN